MWNTDCHRHQGRVAIVTGAASGIGRATAIRLASEGATVVLADMQGDKLEATATEIASKGGIASGMPCNIADEGEVKRLVEHALSKHGKLDILANVAGVSSRHDPIYTASLEEFNRITSINLAGTFLCIKHASAAMKERRYGRIVNVSSIASFRTGAKGNAAYSASKGGVKAMTHQLVLDLSEFGITVNAVAPGVIQTPMTSGGGIERLNARARLIPLGRVGQPEDIAVAIAFLASEEAAFITGQMLTVDGGMTSVVYEAA